MFTVMGSVCLCVTSVAGSDAPELSHKGSEGKKGIFSF